MTVEQAASELRAFLAGDRVNRPDPEEFSRLLDQFVAAKIAEQLEDYQRKPLRFR